MSALAGKRILLAEDEFIVALMAQDLLTELGATVVGPAATLSAALSLARTESLDAAVLDVNMQGERIDPVVEVLSDRDIPFVFTTGYGEGSWERQHKAPILDKPYTQAKLAGALARALDR